MASNSQVKERNHHIVRRNTNNFSFRFLIKSASILCSFLVIITIFSLIGNFAFGETISYMFIGSFGNVYNFNQTILNWIFLFILAIGLLPAFKMRYWNTGALGQALIGNLCSSLVVFYLGKYIGSNFLLLLLALIAALIGGAIWGGIPGIFKAKLNANETLFTLMMNYVAIQVVLIFVEIMKQGAQSLKPFEYGHFSTILGTPYGWPIIIVVLTAIIIFIYLRFTKHGYELSVLGESFNTAKYAGIDTTKVIIRTSILSGAVCALCGFIFTGVSNTLTTSSDGGYGFTSIIVAWSGHFSIISMAFISFLIAFIKKGSEGIKNRASDTMNDYASYISIGIFLFFLIGCEFFLNYKFVPSSRYAKLQEEKREKFRTNHPVFAANYILVKSKIGRCFDNINVGLERIKYWCYIKFDFVYQKIVSFFINLKNKIKKLFTKNKED